MPCFRIPNGIISIVGEYEPGDPPPSGYIDQQEWAKVQMKAGLKQEACGQCGLWNFPQEMSEVVLSMPAWNKAGEEVILTDPLCKKCEAAAKETP